MIVDMLAADPTTPGETISVALRRRLGQRDLLRLLTHPHVRADAPTDGLALQDWDTVHLALRDPATAPVGRAHLVDAAARGGAFFSVLSLSPSARVTGAEVERALQVWEAQAPRDRHPGESFVDALVVGHPSTPEAVARRRARTMVERGPVGVRECGYALAVATHRHGWTLDDVVDRSRLAPGPVTDLLARVAEEQRSAGWSPAALIVEDVATLSRDPKTGFPRFLAAAVHLTGDRRLVDDALRWLADDPLVDVHDSFHHRRRRGALAAPLVLDESLDLETRATAAVAGQQGAVVVGVAQTCGPELADRLVGAVSAPAIVQALATNPAVDVATHHASLFPRTDRVAHAAVAARDDLPAELRATYLASTAGSPPGVAPSPRDEITVAADLVDHVVSGTPERVLQMPAAELAAACRNFRLEPVASAFAATGAGEHPLWPLSPVHLAAATAFWVDRTSSLTFGELLDEIDAVVHDPSLTRPAEVTPPEPFATPVRTAADDAWLETLTDDSAWSATPCEIDAPETFRPLRIGPLADRGTRPVLDVEHDETAWFYVQDARVSDAVLHPGAKTRDEHFWFGSAKAVLLTYEKRAVVHRGRLVRLWPRFTETDDELVVFAAPSPLHPWSSPYDNDTLVEPTGTRSLAIALRTALETSSRTGRPVVLATQTERQDLY